MKNILNFSCEYFASAEAETIIVRVPKNDLDPRLGYDTHVFASLEQLADWLRSAECVK